jgi:large subunit ribosomal protein L3
MTEENKNANQPPQPAPAAPVAPAPKAEPVEMPAGFKFIIGEKVGMTQMFDEKGELYGVSVVKAGPCRVIRTRTTAKDGYQAVCLGFGHRKESHTDSAAKGIFGKLDMKPIRHMKEFRVEDVSGIQDGQTATVQARFKAGEYVDIQGVSKGKGFAGGMKRHNFAGGPASHGASDRERAPGSLASRRSLGRVLPGQRMAGHMGVDTVTVQKVEVLRVRWNENLLYLGGAVPGPKGGLVTVLETVKSMKRRPMKAKVKQVRKDKMGNIIVEQVRTKKKKV